MTKTFSPKRLIEVDLPIKRISAHARKEKSIRHGHISTLHTWWARRPLAACRAVICAALWPDPVDPTCPDSFLNNAKELMVSWAAKQLPSFYSVDSFPFFDQIQKEPERLNDRLALRTALLHFIADFADWDNGSKPEFTDLSTKLTAAAHIALGGQAGTKPMVLDPFSGGGGIPLEALRVGADAFAGELNPVASLQDKVLLEYVPKYGETLAAKVRFWGNWVLEQAKPVLSELYPVDSNGGISVGFIWARTISCEGPNCGARIPLLSNLSLCERSGYYVNVQLIPTKNKTLDIQVNTKTSAQKKVAPTVKRSSATCPICGFTVAASHVRAQFASRKGGTKDACLVAVVTARSDATGKIYRAPNEADLKAINLANEKSAELANVKLGNHSAIPDEELPYLRSIFNIQLLDVKTWGALYSSRQLVALIKFAELIRTAARTEKDPQFGLAIRTCLAFGLDRLADYNSSLCRWTPLRETMGHTFGRQALGIAWDYAESNPISEGSGNWTGAIDWIARVIEGLGRVITNSGHAECVSATHNPLPDDSINLMCTDPPYYDLVPYADLSDFFYVWLKRTVGEDYPALFSGELSPKRDEIVQLAERNEAYSYKTRENYEKLMEEAMAESRRVLMSNGIGVVFFAHKGTEAWESQLQSMINAGWIICGSWPIDTERESRLRAINSATLASSVQLVCRPREHSADDAESIGDWRDVLQALPGRIHEWMPRLAAEGVVGADAIFACIGPALEIFSRYSRVEKASGETVALKEYLEYVWAAVAKEALNMIFQGADTTGFEEDARITAMWFWTISTGVTTPPNASALEDSDEEPGEKISVGTGFAIEYDAARKIAQGLGAHLEGLTNLIEIDGSNARLLSVAERAQFLFGKVDSQIQKDKKKNRNVQLSLEGLLTHEAESASVLVEERVSTIGKTLLDRIHQSMLIFASGRGDALKRYLVEEGVGTDQRFWKLAQALSALYPIGTDEKRWVDGVLARKKGLGF